MQTMLSLMDTVNNQSPSSTLLCSFFFYFFSLLLKNVFLIYHAIEASFFCFPGLFPNSACIFPEAPITGYSAPLTVLSSEE